MHGSRFQLIGTIVGAHGLGGELKLLPLTSWPDRFIGLKRCFIQHPEPKASAGGVVPASRPEGADSADVFQEDGGILLASWSMEGARIHGNKWVLIKLAGVDDRTAAEAFKGRSVHIPKEERIPLEEGEFYQDDLIGCTVDDTSGQVVGVVEDYLDQGGAGIIVVRLDDQSETVMVPFVDVYVDAVSVEQNRMTLTSAWTKLLEALE